MGWHKERLRSEIKLLRTGGGSPGVFPVRLRGSVAVKRECRVAVSTLPGGYLLTYILGVPLSSNKVYNASPSQHFPSSACASPVLFDRSLH